MEKYFFLEKRGKKSYWPQNFKQ